QGRAAGGAPARPSCCPLSAITGDRAARHPAVPADPCPPASFLCATVTSNSVIGFPVSLSTAKGCASRATLSFDTTKAVSLSRRGTKTRSARKSPSDIPETFSITRQDVRRDAVFPRGSWLMRERRLRKSLDLFSRFHLAHDAEGVVRHVDTIVRLE